MMGLTITQARAIVLDHVDVPSTDTAPRWSTSQVDTGLNAMISVCVSDYVAAGGDRLEIEVDASTDTSGEVDLSSYTPVKINGVTAKIGNVFWPISEVAPEQRFMEDTNPYALQIRLTPDYQLQNADATRPLLCRVVNAVVVPANSWNAMEQWICVRTALFLGVKDDDMLQAASRLEGLLRESVLARPRIPTGTRLARPNTGFNRHRGYIYKAGDQKLQVCLLRG